MIKRLVLLFIFLLSANTSFSYEDYTIYTELDVASKLTVSATQVTVTSLRNDSNAYVVSPALTAFSNFTHEVKSTLSAANHGLAGVWAVANVAGSIDDLTGDRIYLRYGEETTNSEIIRLYATISGVTVNDATTDVGENTYYITIDRIGTTVNAYIYNDVSKTSLRDTLTVTLGGSPTFTRVYGFIGKGANVGDGSSVTMAITNLSLSGTTLPEDDPDPEPEPEPEDEDDTIPSNVEYQDDLDYLGGFKHISSRQPTFVLTGNLADDVTGQCIFDQGAFAGKNYAGYRLHGNANKFMYWKIRGNDNDKVCVYPSDRIESNVVTNGNMELNSNWSSLNTPTQNIQTTGTQLPWSTYSRLFEGDAGDGIYQNVLIRGERSGHNTQWFGQHKATFFINVISGTVKFKAQDPLGTIIDVSVSGTTTGNDWIDYETVTGSMDSSYTGSTSGTLSFYCETACKVMVDDVIFGEYSYGSLYNEYVGVDDFNTGQEEYAITQGWTQERIDKNEWIINPFGHATILVALNNFNNTDVAYSATVDFNGRSYCSNLASKYPEINNCGRSASKQMIRLRESGFNAIGSIFQDDVADPPGQNPDVGAYTPYMKQTRVTRWNFSDVGHINFGATATDGSLDGKWFDVFDPDWQNHFTSTGVSGAANWGCCKTSAAGSEFRQIGFSQYDVTPYKSTVLPDGGGSVAWLDPRLIGYDMDEEPFMSGPNFDNFGVQLMASNVTTHNGDSGVNDSKVYAVNFLRKRYSVGSEATFIANITYGGANYLTNVDNWATVGGASASKHSSALSALNAAWGTTYTNWKAVWYEDGDNTIDLHGYGFSQNAGFETSLALYDSGCIGAGNCVWGFNSISTIQDDMDDLQAEYLRDYLKFFDNTINTMYENKVLNFGPGLSGHRGWYEGVTDRDGTTKLLDVFYTHGSLGTEYNYYSSASPTLGSPLSTIHDILGLPIMSESTWITAEPGSDLGFEGVVDRVYKRTDTDYAIHVGNAATDGADWDCDTTVYANIGTYCSATTGAKRVPQDAVIYWGCTDPLAPTVGSCVGNGTQYWFFQKEADSPHVHSAFSNRLKIKANAGSFYTLANNTLVTTGTLMYTLNNPTDITITVTPSTDFVNDTGHGFQNGHRVSITGSLNVAPAGLSSSIFYYVVQKTTNTYKLSLTENGTPVDITGTGTLPVRRRGLYRVEMIEDEGANFNTNYNNPNALDGRYNSLLVVDDDDADDKTQYMMISKGYADERSIVCYKTTNEAGANVPECITKYNNAACYSSLHACALQINTGNNYHTNFIGVTANGFNFGTQYELRSQTDKANMFLHMIRQFQNRKYVSTDGINYVVGYSLWSAAVDGGFAKNGTASITSGGESGGPEIRQFGLHSQKGNLYDGIEATIKGADGIVGTYDDERRNYGNFVGTAGVFNRGIYRSALPKKRILSGRMTGGTIGK